MNLTTEHLSAAMKAAIALTNRDDDRIMVPMKHVDGAMVLNTIAQAILRGDFALVPRQVMEESNQQAAIAKAEAAEFDEADLKPGGTDPDDD